MLKTQQRMGRFVNQILDNAAYPQWARPCATCPLTMPYSEFTDSVPIFFGLTADPVPSAFTAATEPVATGRAGAACCCRAAPPAAGAYLVAPGSYGLAKLLGGLQKWDVPTFRAGAAFNAGGRDYAPGTVIVPPTARARMVLDETAKATGIAGLRGRPDAGRRGLQAQAGHAHRPDPRRQQHARRLADVALRALRDGVRGRQGRPTTTSSTRSTTRSCSRRASTARGSSAGST